MSTNKSSRRRFIKTAAAGAAGLAISSRASSLPQEPPSNVLVTFEGAMVFHRLPRNAYEVGILIEEVAPHHKFTINENGKMIPQEKIKEALLIGKSWRLDVVKVSGVASEAGITRREEGHSGRLDNTRGRHLDLSWIADFESSEFHYDRLISDGEGGRELKMNEEKLQPIIHLSQGHLYSLYKIEKLKRKRGDGPYKDFGFMTETVGLDITLKKDEALVLSVQKEAQKHEIFKLPFPKGKAKIEIGNFLPPEERHGSHFQVYYGLFPDIPKSEKYDIDLECPRLSPQKLQGKSQRKPQRKAQECTPVFPINRHPDIERGKLFTVGDYPCGGILLGTRTRALK